MRAFLMMAALVALAACDAQNADGLSEADQIAGRAQLASEIENLGFPCPGIIGTDANLIVCRVDGANVRVYRLLGAGQIERVEPGRG